MPNWCANNLKIYGSLEQINEIKKLMNGELEPYFGKAIDQSIKFFIAGVARIAQPIQSKLMLENKHSNLIPVSSYLLTQSHEAESTPLNIAFTEWINLLRTNPDLSVENVSKIAQLYEQSGLAKFSLDSLSTEQKQFIYKLIKVQSYDWFGCFDLDIDHLDSYWQLLDKREYSALNFDMRLVIPPKLIPELAGYNGNLVNNGISSPISAFSSYINIYGVKWLGGTNLNLEEITPKLINQGVPNITNNNTLMSLLPHNQKLHGISVDFDTPWAPPSQNVFLALSAKYQCHIVHCFCEQGSGFCGMHEYACGELLNERNDKLVWSEFGEDNGEPEIISPDYVANNLRNYGG